jgi:DNA polymerase-3 subunit chi
MTQRQARIDFYVLQAQSRAERLQFAGRLVDKAWQQGCQVVIQAQNTAMAEELDALLWQIRPESFIPHSCDVTAADPICICQDLDDPPHREVLINLADQPPRDFHRFERLVEIVVQVPEVLASTRQTFSHYREQGYSAEIHKL